jgi:hypothetical protein
MNERKFDVKRVAKKCFTPNKQIWPEMNQGVPRAVNKQGILKKKNIYLNYVNERWGGNKKWPA